MDSITLYVFYGSHTETFTLTRNIPWSDLCTSIQDRFDRPITHLYYCNDNGDIQVLSCDGDWNCLVYGCTTSWLQLSIDPTKTTFSDERLTTKSATLQRPECFATQFESFGKLMDKYNELIQSDDQIKAMMHQLALKLTLDQKPSVDLAEIEAWLEKCLGDSAVNIHASPQRVYGNHTSGLVRSTTLPPTTTVPLLNHVKRAPTAPSSYSIYPDRPRSASSFKPRQTVKGTILGEWPAYSSLYPPPPSTTHTDDPPLSLLDSNIHYDHQESPLSLYPQPPIMASLSDQPRRSIPEWMPSKATMKPDAIPQRSSTSIDSGKHLAWHDDGQDERCKADLDPWKSSQKRQSYKEQHRILKSQQKELERTIRHLKRQEKLEKKEYLKKLHYDQDDDVSNGTPIRKSLSVTSLSSSASSIYSASSALNDSCLQHQNQRLETSFYLPTTLSSSPEQSYRDVLGKADDHYGLDNRFSSGKTSHDNGMTFLKDTLDRLSMNENTDLYSHGSVV